MSVKLPTFRRRPMHERPYVSPHVRFLAEMILAFIRYFAEMILTLTVLILGALLFKIAAAHYGYLVVTACIVILVVLVCLYIVFFTRSD